MSDPFDLPLETVAAVKNNGDTANLKLQGIIDALNADNVDLESILETAGTIALLLG